MSKKEDRSDWVAVEPEFATGASGGAAANEIKKATTAYQYFQKDRGASIKAEITNHGTIPFDIAVFGRTVRDKYNELSQDDRAHYEGLARQDAFRYRQESHAADVAALQRRERLQQERSQILLDDQGGSKRTTRGGWERKQRKRAKVLEKRKKKSAAAKKSSSDDEDDEAAADDKDDDDEESEEWDSGDSDEDASSDDDDDDDDDDDGEPKKKKRKKGTTKPQRRAVSQKQLEHQQKKREEKMEKVTYIAERQQDLRKERAQQAKKRLEFLLKQSNIFSHFGRVKEDTAKYGIRSTTTASAVAAMPPKINRDGGGETDDNRNDNDNGDVGVSATTSSRRKAAEQDMQEENLEEADEHEATFLTHQPTTLGHGNMRDYQLEGLNWMIRLQENGVNGILADEMGLGKTLQSISVLVYMLEYRNVTGPHLIVVPKSTLSNWMNEIARWAPTLTAVKFHGDKSAREEIIRNDLEPSQRDEERTWNVVVTTYEVCNIEKNTLNKFAWSYLIIDEAHRLKNEESAFSQTIRQFETRYRLLLTGTPLQNSLHELWALLNFLVPDVFESSEQFDEWFNLDIEDNDEKNKLISQLHKILKPFVLRRLKADVERTLPPKHETILFIGMSTLQKKLYRDILQRDIEAIRGTSGSRTAILNIVMQLRKCAGHPYLFPGVEDRTLPPLGEHLVENCGKMVLLDKLLKRMRELGHRVLLFTQMTRVLDILEDYLVMRRFPYCRIDGNTSYENREAYIEAYNKPDSEKFLFLLSTRAGGLGINLQTADVVILFDSDWNPQCDLQAQDRAHRIGQKKPVQVFRFVTEHTIEEKIVERAQQKLKLDAMVVQQGRLKGQDSKLSREELLAAVRFGADKIFKSKDSSITDDDIDMILDQGRQKTQEMNEKLKAAEKGDMLDFKLDGTSAQTFEGIDYSGRVRAQEELLGIFDIGKRERKEANYNENTLYQRQIAALQGAQQKKPKKRKDLRLPKHLRLPRMDDFQMYDREALQKIQEEEEATFRELPEEVQKAATATKAEIDAAAESTEDTPDAPPEPFVLPPLLSEERQAEKVRLLAEGFAAWNRNDYNAFWKASARHGRTAYEAISAEVGKSEAAVRKYAEAFWDVGKSRISEHEYDRAVKFIERGEKKIGEVRRLERGTRVFVSLFENPWEELEFTHAHCKDKLFTAEEDRHLLCWARKYGYGQWRAVQLAVRRNPNFRFDYFLRSLPVELLGRRCEQLMKAAEKEVEHYERVTRESKGLPVEPAEGETELPPVELPMFHTLQDQLRETRRLKAQEEKQQLEAKVNEIGSQIQKLQGRLKALNSGAAALPETEEAVLSSEKENVDRKKPTADDEEEQSVADTPSAEESSEPGATGGDGTFVPFPEYSGELAPLEWKKPFTQFCNRTRREVKASLGPEERKNKKKVNNILKERWLEMAEGEKESFRLWTEWDKKRFAHEEAIFTRHRAAMEEEEREEKPPEEDGTESFHVPRKKKMRR